MFLILNSQVVICAKEIRQERPIAAKRDALQLVTEPFTSGELPLVQEDVMEVCNGVLLAQLVRNDPLGYLIIQQLKWQPWMFGLICLLLAFGITFLLAWWDGLAFRGEHVKDRIVFLRDPLVYWYKVFLIPTAGYLMVSIYSRISQPNICFENHGIKIELPMLVKRLTVPILRNTDVVSLIAVVVVLLVLFPTIRRMWSPADVTERWHIYWWAWERPLKLSALWNNLFLYPLMFYFAAQVCFRIFLFSWTMIHTFKPLHIVVMYFHLSDGLGGFKPIGDILLNNYFFLFLAGLCIPVNLIILRNVYNEPLITNSTVVLLITIYLVIAIFSFLAPIYYIHRPMVTIKRTNMDQMENIARKVRAALNKDKEIAANRNITDKELISLVREFKTYEGLKDVYDEVKKARTWPINFAGLLKSIFMTIIPCFLNLLAVSDKAVAAWRYFR